MPKFFETPAFKQLQKQVYKNLKATGFQDIENGVDTNQYDSSTFPLGREPERGQARRRIDFVSLDAMSNRAALSLSVADTDRFQFWDIICNRVRDLPWNAPNRAFLVLVADTANVTSSARVEGLTRKQGYRIWRNFRASIGLPRTARLRPKAEPDPFKACAKVRRFNSRERKALARTLTPPKAGA